MKILAHRDEISNRTQTLDAHLLNVADKAAEDGKKLGLSKSLFILGILHDAGKADRIFQFKIKEKPALHVNHSSAGAKYFMSYIEHHPDVWPDPSDLELFQEYLDVMLYVITSHHGLYDIWRPDSAKNFLDERISYAEIEKNVYHYSEDVVPYIEQLLADNQIDLTVKLKESFLEYRTFSKRLTVHDKTEQNFYSGLKMRLLLSCLKNADIEDTVNAYFKFMEPLNNEDVAAKKDKYLEAVEKHYKSFGTPASDINKIRSALSQEAKKRGRSDTHGIYQLNLPTGAGKTLTCLRYGMQQLVEKEMDRFFYITPFLSVLEQNAQEIKSILDDRHIVEHHSNMVRPDDCEDDSAEEILQQYLMDTWTSPIVLSTMVQFFQTLFGGKANNIRRFSSLAHSVIVLDEVQSLPVETLHLFNMTLNFLSDAMQANVILCTATQPVYDSQYITHKINYQRENLKEIVKLKENERRVFERTTVRNLNNGEFVDEYSIADYINNYSDDSILVILNTKKAVRKVVDLVGDLDRPLYYLSTNLCPKHRQTIIQRIRKELQDDQPVVCISTQLIEAGVDVDFKRLIRSYAGIDSIVQAIGRCNRNGHFKTGYVELARTTPEFENIDVSTLRSIKDKADVTARLIARQQKEIDVVNLNDEFYEYYYADHQSLMDYPLGKDASNGVSLLSTNDDVYRAGQSRLNGLKQSFKSGASKIRLIDNQTTGVIVYYEDSKELIEQLIMAINGYEASYEHEILRSIKSLLEQLQPYTVNIYDFHSIQDKVMSYMNDQIYILADSFYDQRLGVIEISDDFIL
ncbi:CRISPR-associated helicase Cas3' [Macrococcus equipercicus]|uniref:CRISPR-associated helicase Cas3 n=1 Tax=Macrococcus equipercicus TaxID=69967 RepID=A0A9Q9BWI7_9STAP|nr:CRISPR-associated helicase Cas3' [Macrococcus equipercicus]UTH14642.1 CRISPR-associated helicase Cas3' [Macrococcus equipercicus]